MLPPLPIQGQEICVCLPQRSSGQLLKITSVHRHRRATLHCAHNITTSLCNGNKMHCSEGDPNTQRKGLPAKAIKYAYLPFCLPLSTAFPLFLNLFCAFLTGVKRQSTNSYLFCIHAQVLSSMKATTELREPWTVLLE